MPVPGALRTMPGMEHPPTVFRTRRAPDSRGFTAVELMVVMAIAAVLATLAAPSFEQTIKRWQMNQAINALTDTIYFARSEAVKWGGNVQIAKVPNSPDCSTATDNEWSCGWEVKLNPIPSRAVGIPADGILKRVQANEKTSIHAPSSNSTLKLNRWGNPNAGYSLHVVHKRDEGDPTLDQYLCLSSGGRLRQAGTCS
jgi:type IV fimbrial biogenesis protein FimT